MKTEKELDDFHSEMIEKYKGKQTDKGIIENVYYLIFNGFSGGSYSDKPKLKGKGLVCGIIGNNAFPIGELIFK